MISKQQLIEQIEAYAVARATGNALLIRGSLGMLEASLAKLPDKIKEKKPPKEVKPSSVG